MTNMYGIFTLMLSTIIFIAAPTQADIVVTGIEGLWTEVDGGSNVSGLNTNSISWGVTNGQKSGYIFQPSPVSFPVTPDTQFDLGTFTHNNFPISSGGITGATLTTDFMFSIDSTPVSASMVYNFLHDETPNTGGGGCCDDIVVAVNNNVFSDTFLIGGVEYQLNITGFKLDDGTVLSEFNTKEGQSNSATLVAEINRSVPVPEPSTYLLLSSMLVLAMIVRKRSKKVV